MWFRRKDDIDVDELRRRLRDVVAWCEFVLANGPGMRAVDLLPPRSETEAAEQRAAGREPPDWVPTSLDARLGTAPNATAAAVVAERAAKMCGLGLAASPDGDRLRESGRILCCFVGASLLDAACNEVSKGFLDADDFPPCDTWVGIVAMGSPCLLAWVPDRHVADVDAAIPYCPTEAYRWLSSVNPQLERALLRGR